MLSAIIPARDEGCIVETLNVLTSTLRAEIIPHEIIVASAIIENSQETIAAYLDQPQDGAEGKTAGHV